MASSLRILNRIYARGRTPLDEWSARPRDLNLHRTTQHINTRYKHPCRQRDSSPRFPATKRQKTYALDRAATEIGIILAQDTQTKRDKIDGTCNTHEGGENFTHYFIRGVRVGGRTILKWLLKKYDMRMWMWSLFIWLRMMLGSCGHINGTYLSTQDRI
jgi:hypothetical protein